MNNEEKILGILEQIQNDISGMKADISGFIKEQIKLEQKLDEGFDRLDFSINEAFKDIDIIESRVHRHEREFHGVE